MVPIDGKNPASPVSSTATLTDDQIKDLQAGKWYANVHTAANPGGEIRGQVMRADRAAMMQGGATHAMGGACDARQRRHGTDEEDALTRRYSAASAGRNCSRCSARSIHCAVSFSCTPFWPSRSRKAGEIDPVERLVLVEAGEHDRPLARLGIDVRLQALGADLLHHALHRRVDRADRAVCRGFR